MPGPIRFKLVPVSIALLSDQRANAFSGFFISGSFAAHWFGVLCKQGRPIPPRQSDFPAVVL